MPRLADPALLRLLLHKAGRYLGLPDRLVSRTAGNWNAFNLVLSKEDLTMKFRVARIGQKPIQEQSFPRGSVTERVRLHNAGVKAQNHPHQQRLLWKD